MKDVLIIEDNEFMRDIISTKLLEHNYTVRTAPTAKIAYKKLKEQKPDVVILDIELPDEHGFEILKKMKSDEESNSIPVIIFSNNDDPDVEKEGKKLGAHDFYLKASTDPSDLVAKIATLFEE